ncbi:MULTISPECIES: hypothetical protein [Cyanophyceae]|nr:MULTISPECIES: hypothetical protein [Cyanophyceae]
MPFSVNVSKSPSQTVARVRNPRKTAEKPIPKAAASGMRSVKI